MEILSLTSSLFMAGSAMKRAFSKWKKSQGSDEPSTADDTNTEVSQGLECKSMEAAIIAVGSELAMKAYKAFFASRSRRWRDRTITGLSPEFATNRNQVRKAAGTTANLVLHPSFLLAHIVSINGPR